MKMTKVQLQTLENFIEEIIEKNIDAAFGRESFSKVFEAREDMKKEFNIVKEKGTFA